MFCLQQIGGTVYDDARFARARTCQHQAVFLFSGNDGFLDGVQTVGNRVQGLRRNGFFQFFQTAFEP